jgi:hypothetical protein
MLNSDTLQSYEGGATRSKMDVDLSLIPKSAVMALGRRLTLGAQRHGRNNWRKGGEEFRVATITHIMKHLLDYMENGNITDDNIGAIICNAAFLCEYEERSPYKVSDGVFPQRNKRYYLHGSLLHKVCELGR